MKEVIADKVLEIVNTNIENGFISSNQFDADLCAAGMDSISFIRIIVALEEEFDIEIPDEKLLLAEMNTVSKITDVISSILKVPYEADSYVDE